MFTPTASSFRDHVEPLPQVELPLYSLPKGLENKWNPMSSPWALAQIEQSSAGYIWTNVAVMVANVL